MKTGAELISEERKEQIEKHGWDIKNDEDYSNNELLKAALFAINPDQFEWPFNWTPEFRNKILLKTNTVERLKVAGAFIAAEIDRLKCQQKKYGSFKSVSEKCPECLENTGIDELKMFGGICELCHEQKLKDELDD